MIKKILAFVIATAMLLCMFGCGGNTENTEENKQETKQLEGGKIALFIGTQESDSETFSKAAEISKAYGNEVMILGYDPYDFKKSNNIEKVSSATADDPEVKAMIFSNAAEGTEAAVKAVKEKRDDMFIIVCNPVEGVDGVCKYADVVLSLDFTAFANALIAQSKTMGAESFVFYTHNRHLSYPAIRQLRTATESACEESGITFKLATCVDIYEKSRDLESAKLYIREDVTRREKKFGKNTVLFSTDNLVQSEIAKEVTDHGMLMVSSFLPSPLLLTEAFSVEMKDNLTNSTYAVEQLKASVSKTEASGRISTWGCSLPVLMIEAGFNFAAEVLESGNKDVTADAISKCLNTYSHDAVINVEQSESGAFFVSSDFITL